MFAVGAHSLVRRVRSVDGLADRAHQPGGGTWVTVGVVTQAASGLRGW